MLHRTLPCGRLDSTFDPDICVGAGSLGVLGQANDSGGELASVDPESALDHTSDQSTDDSTVLQAAGDGPTVRRQLQSLETMYSEVGSQLTENLSSMVTASGDEYDRYTVLALDLSLSYCKAVPFFSMAISPLN